MDAILFDVDDTLYDQRAPFEKAVRESFAWEFPMEEFYRTFRRYSDEKFEDSEAGLISMREMYCYRVRSAVRAYGHEISDEEGSAFQEKYVAQLSAISMTDTMKQLLDRCRKRGLAMGVVTNGPCEHQKNKLRALQVNRWIREAHWYVSSEIGCSKPDPEIFRYALRDMGLDAKRTLYVGDMFVNDVEGASAAGLHSLWFNRRHRDRPQVSLQPDGIVDSEEALCAWICRVFQI